MLRDDIVIISLDKLVPFEEQPFHVIDDEAMAELVESIKSVGVLVPITVRPIQDGKYEIISGHRRKRACEIAGIDKVSAIIKELSDTEAAIMLVDSNLQRERILPSERAYAYRLKMDAMKHQGKSLGQNVPKVATSDVIGEADNRTGRQVRRYIRLTELIDSLLQKVDEGAIPVTVGTELSYLNVKWQSEVNDILESELCPISVKQAKEIKNLFLRGNITQEIIQEILKDDKTLQEVRIDANRFKSFFPKEYTLRQCIDKLWEILATQKY